MEEKSFLQKLTVKHKSNMRENYCKKTEMEEIIPTNDSLHIKGREERGGGKKTYPKCLGRALPLEN